MNGLRNQYRKSYRIIIREIKGRVASNPRRQDIIQDIYHLLLDLQQKGVLSDPIISSPKKYAESIIISLAPARIPYMAFKLMYIVLGMILMISLAWTVDRYLIRETLDSAEVSFDATQGTLIWNVVQGASSYEVFINGIFVDETQDTTYVPVITNYEATYAFQIKALPEKAYDLASISLPVTYHPQQIIETVSFDGYTTDQGEAYYEVFQTADVHGHVFFEFIPWFDGSMTFVLRNISTDQPILSFGLSVQGDLPVEYHQAGGSKSIEVRSNTRYLFIVRSLEMNHDVSLQIKSELIFESDQIPELTIEGGSTFSAWIRFETVNYAFYQSLMSSDDTQISFYTLLGNPISIEKYWDMLEVRYPLLSSSTQYMVMVIHNASSIAQTVSLVSLEFDDVLMNGTIILDANTMIFMHRLDVSSSTGSLRIQYDYTEGFHILDVRDEFMDPIYGQTILYPNQSVYRIETTAQFIHLIWHISPTVPSSNPLFPATYLVTSAS
jgi:hypothetical protein